MSTPNWLCVIYTCALVGLIAALPVEFSARNDATLTSLGAAELVDVQTLCQSNNKTERIVAWNYTINVQQLRPLRNNDLVWMRIAFNSSTTFLQPASTNSHAQSAKWGANLLGDQLRILSASLPVDRMYNMVKAHSSLYEYARAQWASWYQKREMKVYQVTRLGVSVRAPFVMID